MDSVEPSSMVRASARTKKISCADAEQGRRRLTVRTQERETDAGKRVFNLEGFWVGLACQMRRGGRVRQPRICPTYGLGVRGAGQPVHMGWVADANPSHIWAGFGGSGWVSFFGPHGAWVVRPVEDALRSYIWLV